MTGTGIPGIRFPAPLTTLGWLTRPGPMLERAHARYGDVFTMHVLQEPEWVMLADPAAVKQVFTGDPRLLHAGKANAILRPILGASSVLLLDDDAHMRQRRLMLPPFHGDRLAAYRQQMREVAEREVATWPRDTTLALRPRMQAVTLEIILRTVFGARDAARREALRAALRDLLELLGDPRTFVAVVALGPERLMRFGPGARALRAVDALIGEEISSHRRAGDLAERDDILSLLLQARHEDGSAMTDTELRDELVTLLVAGHETTATSLAWAMERLVRHPDALDALIADVGAGHEAYAEAVCKETLRLKPVIPLVLRHVAEPIEIAGHEIPAGAVLAPSIYLVHRRPEVYPQPYRFRPERFLEGQGGTYTWFPFGGGVRRCLGASFALMEMRAVLRAVADAWRPRAATSAPERTIRRAITFAPARDGEVVVA